MKRTEFILQYCAASNMSIHEYTRHFIALPCNCKEDGCEGWATIPNSPFAIANHFELCDYRHDNVIAELERHQPLRADLQGIVRASIHAYNAAKRWEEYEPGYTEHERMAWEIGRAEVEKVRKP